MEKGYELPRASHWGYATRIKTRGEEVQEKQSVPGYRVRRWVAERTHSWMNRYRRPANYVAMLHLACALITFRSIWVSG
jgi:putative transposase